MKWKTYDEYKHDVEVRIKPNQNPVTIAVFDGEEQVTEEVAALQLDEIVWAAEAYAKAKGKYSIDIEE